MASTMKQFRLKEDTIEQILYIKRFMEHAYERKTESLGMPPVKVSQADAVRYAVEKMYGELKALEVKK